MRALCCMIIVDCLRSGTLFCPVPQQQLSCLSVAVVSPFHPSALSGFKAAPLHCQPDSGFYIAEVADCGREMPLSVLGLSSCASHPLIHKISNI